MVLAIYINIQLSIESNTLCLIKNLYEETAKNHNWRFWIKFTVSYFFREIHVKLHEACGSSKLYYFFTEKPHLCVHSNKFGNGLHENLRKKNIGCIFDHPIVTVILRLPVVSRKLTVFSKCSIFRTSVGIWNFICLFYVWILVPLIGFKITKWGLFL